MQNNSNNYRIVFEMDALGGSQEARHNARFVVSGETSAEIFTKNINLTGFPYLI